MSTITVPQLDRRLSEPDYAAFPASVRRDAMQAGLEVPLLAALLHLPQGGRVLEVGCGGGNALPVLAERCRPSRLTGLDLDVASLTRAARRLQEARIEAELVEGDVRDLPFPDASFDLVVDFGTCYHVARPEHALSEIERVLASGGLLVHETRASQLLAHPVRSFGRTLPWDAAPALVPHRHALLWASRVKEAHGRTERYLLRRWRLAPSWRRGGGGGAAGSGSTSSAMGTWK